MQLNTGLADAVISWADVTGSQKPCEPAKFVYHANIGSVIGHEITFNKDVWAKLPASMQKAVREAAPLYAKAQADFALAGAKTQREYCVTQQAMKIVEATETDRQAWAEALPPLALDWARDQDKKGRPGTKVLEANMAGLRAGGAKPARNWDKE